MINGFQSKRGLNLGCIIPNFQCPLAEKTVLYHHAKFAYRQEGDKKDQNLLSLLVCHTFKQKQVTEVVLDDTAVKNTMT